jgi:hypothetical protein
MSPDEMADVELSAMAHSSIQKEKRDEASLKKASSPLSELLIESGQNDNEGSTGESPSAEISSTEISAPTYENMNKEVSSSSTEK